MEQRFYLITGVMASGKSTTAQALAQALPRCVHLRGDLFRRMIVTGREEMADPPTEEALRQLHLRFRLAAQAARGYWEAGFSVVLQDNYYGPALEEMASLLRGIPLRLVVLCPSVETVQGPGGFPREEGLCGLFPRGPVAQLYAGDAPRGPLAGQLPHDGGAGCGGDPLPGGGIRPLCIDRLERGKLRASTSERMR